MKIMMRRFCVLLFLAVLPIASAIAHDTKNVPCSVDTQFGDDANGVFTAFVLKFQYKNTSRRTIGGVSVLVRDESGEIVNNSDADCNIAAAGLEAGDAGQCEKVLQVITGKMSQKVGYDIWVKMIDDQKQKLSGAHSCEVTGVRYK